MRTLGLFLVAAIFLGCAHRDPLPGPAIPLYTEVPAGAPGTHVFSRSRGVMEMYLTREEPEKKILNGPADVWGTVTLINISEDGSVTITLSDQELTARAGRAFPGTGIHVIASHAGLGTALLRSRWVHTRVIVERPSADEARQLDTLPGFSAVHPLPGGRVYLEGDRQAMQVPGFEVILSIRSEAWGEAGYANPGDTIHVELEGVLGGGARWLVFLGAADDGQLLFYKYSWFYDILPDRKMLVAVPPYGQLPYTTPQVTDYGDDGPFLTDHLTALRDELGDLLLALGSMHAATNVYASSDGLYEIVVAYNRHLLDGERIATVTKVSRRAATTPHMLDRMSP